MVIHVSTARSLSNAVSIRFNLRSVGLIAFCAIVFSQSAFAGLIGDTLTFRRLYPEISIDFNHPSTPPGGVTMLTPVVAGTGDLTTVQVGTFNPEDFTIGITLDGPNNFGTFPLSTFNGFGIFGASATIADVTWVANGISVPEVFVQDNAIYVQMRGLYSDGATVDLTIEFSPSAVPEPSVLLGFLTASSLGLLFVRRRRA